MSAAGTVLWWGRFDPDYSRNRVLRQAFERLNWQVVDFIPFSSMTAGFEARCKNIPKHDMVWVPSFRQRDVAAASRWAKKINVPLVFDPLISSFDKQVFERRLLKEGSVRAKRLHQWEQKLFNRVDVLVADTSAHAGYFCTDFSVPKEDVLVVPVGAEENLFTHQGPMQNDGRVEVLFFGTFIDLQGPITIVEAASRCQDEKVIWTMLGAGPLLAECQTLASRLNIQNLHFESWIDYKELPQRISRADILLGVFGVSRKASSVIPNKVYQSLACGRPVITRESTAYPSRLMPGDYSGLIQIEPGNPEVLLEKVMGLVASQQRRHKCSDDARRIYDEYFSGDAVAAALESVIQRALE